MSTDFDVLSRLRKLEAQVEKLLHAQAERDRLSRPTYLDAPAYKLNDDGNRVLIWPVSDYEKDDASKQS